MELRVHPLIESKKIAISCAFVVALVSILVLLGWQFDLPVLTKVVPGFVSMKANTALGLGCFAIALMSLSLPQPTARQLSALIAGICIVFAALVAVLTLIEYVTDLNLGIDELLFRDLDRIGRRYPPGRLAPITAVCFILMSLGVYFSVLKHKKWYRFAQSLFFVVALLSVQALVSYMLGIQTSFGIASHTRIAVHTALAIMLLAIGFISFSADSGFVRVIFSQTEAGSTARRLIVAALFVPPLVNLFEMFGRNAGYYDADFGILLRVIGSMVFFVIMVLQNSERLYAIDRARKSALADVVAREKERSRLIAEREAAALKEQSEAKFRAELIEARQRAEREAAEKAEFLARMSHEIRTPLGGIIGLADLLNKTGLDERQAKQVETLQTSGRALLMIINDILDFSKIGAGKVEIENVQFNLRSMVQAQVDLMTATAADRGLMLKLSIDPLVPSLVGGDSVKIGQVLNNLIGNAIKFTPHGEIEINLTVVRPDEGDRLRIRFSVKDSGVGIAREVQAKLFRPYAQGDSSTARRFGGTGLGLSISQSLVELMGGKIGVESEVLKGSTFWFEVELSRVIGESSPAIHSVECSHFEKWKGYSVLVAEDNSVNQYVVESYLHDLGFKVTTVSGGYDVLEALEKSSFDLILMDCQMPDMDGYATTARVREGEAASGRHTPVVALTANALKEDKERCLAAGMDDYLAKPFNLDELCQMLKRWLPLESEASSPNPSKERDW